MKKQGKIMELFDKVVTFADEHQREIMLGTAIAGTVLTAVTSFRAGMKASKVLEEQKEKMDKVLDGAENMTEEEFDEKKKEVTVETVKRMAPIVAPVVLSASGTIIPIVAGYKEASKQIAVLTSLYNISEKAYSEYQEKTKELTGEKKSIEIADKVKEQHIVENPLNPETVITTGKGDVKCFDEYSGRYFLSSPEEIKKAVNHINKRLMDEYYISLNEFYDELGLPDIKLGEDIGFNIDDGLIDTDHIFSAILHSDDTPILVLNYDVSAKYTEHRGKMFK